MKISSAEKNGLVMAPLFDLAMKYCLIFFKATKDSLEICLDEDLKDGPYPIFQLQSGQFKIAEDHRDAIDLETLKKAVKDCQPWKPVGKIAGDVVAKQAAIDFHNKKFELFKAARAGGKFKTDQWFEFMLLLRRCSSSWRAWVTTSRCPTKRFSPKS